MVIAGQQSLEQNGKKIYIWQMGKVVGGDTDHGNKINLYIIDSVTELSDLYNPEQSCCHPEPVEGRIVEGFK